MKKIAKRLLKEHIFFNKQIFFLHIPRCGGTSIYYALKKLYLPPQRKVYLKAGASLKAAKLIYNIDDEQKDDFQSITEYREKILIYIVLPIIWTAIGDS